MHDRHQTADEPFDFPGHTGFMKGNAQIVQIKGY